MGSKTFNYTGGWQKFTVPKDVTSLNVSLDGASSDNTRGGRVTGTVRGDWVKGGAELFVLAGQHGRPNSGVNGGDATVGGGGAGGRGTSVGGDSGGGASFIRRGSTTGGVIAVAGGAGGFSGDSAKATRTNWITNPTFEVNTTDFNWNILFGAYIPATSIATSTTRAWTGTRSALVTAPADPAKGVWTGWATGGLTPGGRYTFSTYVYVPTGGPDVFLDVAFRTVGPVMSTKNQWVRMSVTFNASGDFHFFGVATVGSTTGGTYYVDGGLFEAGDGTGSYFDGSTAPAGYTVQWLGTPNLSQSRATATAPPAPDVNGRGGRGGATQGEHGFPGTSQGAAPTGYSNAVGGSQTQGGRGGTNSQGVAYDGGSAAAGVLARAGAGGNGRYGGGGGGGGYHGGGGGQGSQAPVPGGGGAGGSSYISGLSTYSWTQGGAALGHGSVTITWVDPGKKNSPPTIPTDVTIGGKAAEDSLATHAVDHVQVCAQVDDINNSQDLRLVLRLSETSKMTAATTHVSAWTDQGAKEAKNPNGVKICFQVTGLKTNTHYYGRLFSEDKSGHFSSNYRSINFWTDRSPEAPVLLNPFDNSQFPDSVNITFGWNFVDPDGDTNQRGFQLRYRQIVSIGQTANPWTTLVNAPENGGETFTVAATSAVFTPNNSYEWSVRTRDQQGLWGPWAISFRFALAGDTKAPTLISPINNRAVPVDVPVEFQWKYNDPRTPYEPQDHADIRWRVVGTNDWITTYGTAAQPGANQSWLFNTGLFVAGLNYEWQARTYSSTTAVSAWSNSGFFWSILTPGSAVVIEPLPTSESIPAPPLGCGDNRVYVYERGGDRYIGEILPATQISWNRRRDDISTCNIVTNGFGWDCGEMLKSLRSFQHEIVVFRDGVRVWEGPITRIAYYTDRVEVEARDVMTYVYRRILRQGYNDSYQMINGVEVGIRSVVERAQDILVDALAYDDPNILAYLTAVSTNTDAKESRIVPPYSRTAWEEVDDLAATAGLDYTTVGRRIILWDTHNQIGLLPEMRDGDFSDSPVVTEYGMNLCNYFAVTNNSGIWGAARPVGDSTGNKPPKYYGWVEQLASAYGESPGGGSSTTLTASAQAALVDELTRQAKRNIAARWPSPVIVRVPDNSTLNPEINVGINQLIPGVHIPLRATNTLRPISQMQKLDSVTVTQDATGEKVAVVMSPAPKPSEDFDADAAATEDA